MVPDTTDPKWYYIDTDQGTAAPRKWTTSQEIILGHDDSQYWYGGIVRTDKFNIGMSRGGYRTKVSAAALQDPLLKKRGTGVVCEITSKYVLT